MRDTPSAPVPSPIETLQRLGLDYRVLDEKTIILRVTPRELPLLRWKFFDNPVFQVEVHFTEEEWERRSEIRLRSPVKRWWVMPPTRVYEEMVHNKEFGLIYFPASRPFEIGVSITPPRFRE